MIDGLTPVPLSDTHRVRAGVRLRQDGPFWLCQGDLSSTSGVVYMVPRRASRCS
jgi:hypothetical protein